MEPDCNNNANQASQCVVVNGNPSSQQGEDVATLLDYADTKKAIANSATEADQHMTQHNGCSQSPTGQRDRAALLINEPCLYCLMFGHKKQETLYVKPWVGTEVLPAVKTCGVYAMKVAAK